MELSIPDKTQNFTQTLMEIFYSTAYFRGEIVHVDLQHDLKCPYKTKITILSRIYVLLFRKIGNNWGPFHFISTPPLWKRSIKIYPLRIKDQTCRHVPPHQKLPKFSFPLRKKAIFFQTPRKYLKDQRRRRRDPLRNDVQAPPQKISSIGGVWILNGMALEVSISLNLSFIHSSNMSAVQSQTGKRES